MVLHCRNMPLILRYLLSEHHIGIFNSVNKTRDSKRLQKWTGKSFLFMSACTLVQVHGEGCLCCCVGARFYVCLWNCGRWRSHCHSTRWHLSEYGAVVEWCWQEKTEEFEEKSVPVPLCPSKIPLGLPWELTRVSTVRSRRLTDVLRHGGGRARYNILQYT